MNSSPVEMPDRIFLSVKQLVAKYPWCTHGGVRSWIFNENSNGFNKVVRRVGRKILINEKLFLEWIDSHGS